jgi:hypothetical protein
LTPPRRGQGSDFSERFGKSGNARPALTMAAMVSPIDKCWQIRDITSLSEKDAEKYSNFVVNFLVFSKKNNDLKLIILSCYY